MGRTHYIAMSGDHGYMPDYCDVYPTADSAARGLAQLFELGKTKAAELKRNGYLEFNKRRYGWYGAEYASIDACNCDDPGQHSEHGIDEDFFA